MTETKRILVPVDFSLCSREALRYALFLRSKLGAEVELLHVVEPLRYVSVDVLSGTSDLPFLHYATEHLAEEEAAFLEGIAPGGAPLSIGSTEGEPHHVIVERSRDFDLVVMGTHGRTGFQQLVMGSVAARVVRRALCPVVTVPLPGDIVSDAPRKLERLLVAVDLSDCSKPAARVAAQLARVFGAELEVLHVWEPPAFLLGKLTLRFQRTHRTPDEFAAESQAAARVALREWTDAVLGEGTVVELAIGPADKRIVERAEQQAFDLVVVGTHGNTGLPRMLLGSVAEKVLRSCDVPALTVHGG